MAAFSYKTIESPVQGAYKEKGSRFLAFAFPITSEADAKERLEELRKKYFDARHHCFAYILGENKERFRAADDGEPNHSAGDPILGQIRSRDLTNVLIVVIRYFGGVKLGVGGLVSAYKIAADDALKQATVIVKEILRSLALQYEYANTPEVMKLVKDFDLVIRRQAFEEDCKIIVEYRLAIESQLLEKIALLQALGNKITIHD